MDKKIIIKMIDEIEKTVSLKESIEMLNCTYLYDIIKKYINIEEN